MDIQVVLIQDDPKLGKRGDVVKVSSGFAQNFLFPNHKAKPATADNVAPFQAEKNRLAKEEAGKVERARELSKKLASASVTIEAEAGEGDRLFGAVTNADVAQALAKQGIAVDKKEIHFDEPVKKVGAYTASVKLHRDVQAKLKVWVVGKKHA